MSTHNDARLQEAFARLSVYRTGTGRIALHALTGIVVGFTLLTEPPGGYMLPVFMGPVQMVDWLPFPPFKTWGLVLVVLGFLTLRGSGLRASIWPLVGLGTTWMLFGSSALFVGLTSEKAASIGGEVFIALAFGAVLRALEITYWLQITSNYDDRR